MSSMKRYLELKKECEDKGIDSYALSQYLHISQVTDEMSATVCLGRAASMGQFFCPQGRKESDLYCRMEK